MNALRSIKHALVGLLLLVQTACSAIPPEPTTPAGRGAESLARYARETTVALVFVDEEGEGHRFCSGVRIAGNRILTAAHCIVAYQEETGELCPNIENHRGRQSGCDVLAVDGDRDLALLHSRADQGPSAVLGPLPEVGAPALAVGHPFGLEWTVTFGRISAQRYAGGEHQVPFNWTQYDGGIAPGNSGGPLFDDQGRVVGIASFYIIFHGHLGGFVAADELGAFLLSAQVRNGLRP